jgi:hypothetical protein
MLILIVNILIFIGLFVMFMIGLAGIKFYKKNGENASKSDIIILKSITFITYIMLNGLICYTLINKAHVI